MMSKHSLIVDIKGQIAHLPFFSGYYRNLQSDLHRLSPEGLQDLRQLLREVEQMHRNAHAAARLRMHRQLAGRGKGVDRVQL